MKIVLDLNIETKDELLDAINNGIVALNNIRGLFALGIDWQLPHEWLEFLKKHNNNKNECDILLTERLKLLHQIYNQLSEEEYNKDFVDYKD